VGCGHRQVIWLGASYIWVFVPLRFFRENRYTKIMLSMATQRLEMQKATQTAIQQTMAVGVPKKDP
jgi:hypothetical protein